MAKLLTGWLIVALTAFFYMYEYALRIIPGISLNEVMSIYKITPAQAGFLDTTYFITYVPLQLLVGSLLDEYGSKRLLIFAILCCAIGCAVSALEWSYTMAIIGRLSIGAGSAFAFVAVLKNAATYLPHQYFARISGMTTSLGMLGGILGEEGLGWLIERYNSQKMYLVAAAIGMILSLFIALLMDKDPEISSSMKQRSWHVIRVDISNTLSISQIWWISLLGCGLFAPLAIWGSWGISFLQQTHQFSKLDAAYTIDFLYWGWAIGAPVVGFLSDRWQMSKPFLIISALTSTFVACLIIFLPVHIHWPLPLLFWLLGICGCSQVLIFNLSRKNVTEHLVGTALAITNMIVMLSTFLHPLVGWLLARGHSHTIYQTEQWQIALSILPALLLLALFCAMKINDKHHHTR